MNRMMREMVDIAFRARAWNRARAVAVSENAEIPPMPRVVVDFARSIAGKKPDACAVALYEGMNDEQRHTIVRVLVTLDWLARAGCPIVVLDEMTARGFATVSPPPADAPLEWPLGAAYGFSIGEGAALVRHPVSTAHVPTEMREHFTLVSEIVQMELWGSGIDFLPDADALANFTDNTGAALARRPDGLP